MPNPLEYLLLRSKLSKVQLAVMDSTQEITIKVSPKVAVAYQNATEQEKQRLQTLVTLFLERDTSNNTDLLGVIMNEISARAQKRGLTPEILESILRLHAVHQA